MTKLHNHALNWGIIKINVIYLCYVYEILNYSQSISVTLVSVVYKALTGLRYLSQLIAFMYAAYCM